MSRYIEREALKRAIRKAFPNLEMRIEINSIINEQPTANVPQWIPCSERLPEGDEIVLVNVLPIAPYQIILATAKDVRKYYTEGAVDAWMQLPEPWKEVDDEQIH